MPPVIAPFLHWSEGLRARRAAPRCSGDRRALTDRLVGEPLQGKHLPAAVASIGGDDGNRLGIVDPVAQRFRRETAEHHRVHRTDARARQHGDHCLRNHWQINGYPVSALDAEALERVGAAADFPREIPVGQDALLARFSLPNESRLVTPGTLQVTVQAVCRGVELSVYEPAGMRRVPLEDGRPGGNPLERARLFLPERFPVATCGVE